MNNIDDIISEEIQTSEDEISGEFCSCGHKIDEHFVGEITNSSKCMSLNFNGTVFSSCYCSNITIPPFTIIARVNYA